MVLMLARRGRLDYVKGDQRGSRGELVNEPRDLTKNQHSDSLKKDQLSIFQGMFKKGDDVAVCNVDNVVRTSVSQNRVIATLCTKELFLRTQYI